MTATRDGDLDAFEILVERHRDTAVKVAYRVLGQRTDAEEMAQEAFLNIFEAADRYEPTASFTTYLYRVVTNLCYDRIEKNGPGSLDPVKNDGNRSEAESPEQQLMRREQQEAIQSALDELPARQRIAITLQHFEDLKYVEIAEVMETSEKAVERLVARARDRLKTLLVEEDAVDTPAEERL